MEKAKLDPASGDTEALINAPKAIASAQTVEQLRQAQAVVLPLHARSNCWRARCTDCWWAKT